MMKNKLFILLCALSAMTPAVWASTEAVTVQRGGVAEAATATPDDTKDAAEDAAAAAAAAVEATGGNQAAAAAAGKASKAAASVAAAAGAKPETVAGAAGVAAANAAANNGATPQQQEAAQKAASNAVVRYFKRAYGKDAGWFGYNPRPTFKGSHDGFAPLDKWNAPNGSDLAKAIEAAKIDVAKAKAAEYFTKGKGDDFQLVHQDAVVPGSGLFGHFDGRIAKGASHTLRGANALVLADILARDLNSLPLSTLARIANSMGFSADQTDWRGDVARGVGSDAWYARTGRGLAALGLAGLTDAGLARLVNDQSAVGGTYDWLKDIHAKRRKNKAWKSVFGKMSDDNTKKVTEWRKKNRSNKAVGMFQNAFANKEAMAEMDKPKREDAYWTKLGFKDGKFAGSFKDGKYAMPTS